ncbi:hypothetical protein BCV69DRAFT_296785 [Microstroma glucosiphilum]|uniref:Fork-head domain-containing protein n=1 Tax=Pseudomicrostroma glucosiphilum TaxID=1684307 RepID=A0A316UCD7_9BASI|nr:hypothetical protein BCV69DRAFT_296785 [Pseudomicrostroma glucosiphilum]PWN22812.1 hypothetical protein BCV69DRAFT_296785 [Pseudomicrostroma glucosiphilum]
METTAAAHTEPPSNDAGPSAVNTWVTSHAPPGKSDSSKVTKQHASQTQQAEAGPSRIPSGSPPRPRTSVQKGGQSLPVPPESAAGGTSTPNTHQISQGSAYDHSQTGLNEEHAQLLASLAAGHQIGLNLAESTPQSSHASASLQHELADAVMQHANAQSSHHLGEQTYDHEYNDDDEDESGVADGPQGPIQAYAKIDFPGFSIYIQTLRVTIGRRPAHLAHAYTSDYPRQINGSTKIEGDVDIDLGKVKAISRLHAVIYYHAGPFHPQPYPGGGHPDASHLYRSFWREPNQQLRDLFVMEVLGKHGAMVDDVYIRQGGIIQLGKRTKIQIAERVFYFVLPPNVVVPPLPSKQLDSLSPSEDESMDGSDDENDDSDDEASQESDSSELSDSKEGGEGEGQKASSTATAKSTGRPKVRPKLVLKRKGVASDGAGGGKGKGKGKGKYVKGSESHAGGSDHDMELDVDTNEVKAEKSSSSKKSKKQKDVDSNSISKDKDKALPAWAQGAGIAGSKRKRGDPTSDEEALAVGTPIGVEALEAEKRAKAAKKRLAKAQQLREAANGDPAKEKEADRIEQSVKRQEEGEGKEKSQSKEKGQGKEKVQGKGKGKGETSSKSSKSTPAATSTGSEGAIDLSKDASPLSIQPPSEAPQASVSVSVSAASAAPPKVPLPDASSTLAPGDDGVKPALTNTELITAALRSPECVDGRGKMTMLEVFDWLQKRWGWFKANGKHNGRDWQNSLKSTFPSSKDFTKIPRRPNEPGKGNLYTMSDSPLAVRHREEIAEAKAKAALAAAASEGSADTAPTSQPTQPKAVPPTGSFPVPAPNPPSHASSPARGPAATAATVAAIVGGGAALEAVSSVSAPVASTSSLPAARSPVPAPVPPVRPEAASASPAPVPPAAAKAGSPATPGGTPKPQQCVPLVVGAPPANAVIPNKGKPAPGSVEALLDAPPIVHHDGKLYLSAPVFGHLSAQQLTEIERMGPQKALQTLQGLLVEHLKFKVRQQQLASQARSQASPSPQPLRQGTPSGAARPPATPGVPSPRPQAPVQANYGGSPAGYQQRPPGQPYSNTSSPAPAGVYAQNRPPPSQVPRPGPNGSYQYQQQPMMRPQGGTSVTPGSPAPPRPYPRPPNTNQPRPAYPTTSAARPSGTMPPSANSPAGQSRPSGPLSRPPTAYSPSPGPRPPVGGYAPAGAVPSGPMGRPPPPRPYTGNIGGPRPPSHAPQTAVEALSTLSSHPEAPGLMALLRQQGQTPGEAVKNLKLTPGQIQLLQMANAMAAVGGGLGGNGPVGASRPGGGASPVPPSHPRPLAPPHTAAQRPPAPPSAAPAAGSGTASAQSPRPPPAAGPTRPTTQPAAAAPPQGPSTPQTQAAMATSLPAAVSATTASGPAPAAAAAQVPAPGAGLSVTQPAASTPAPGLGPGSGPSVTPAATPVTAPANASIVVPTPPATPAPPLPPPPPSDTQPAENTAPAAPTPQTLPEGGAGGQS